jgi:endonuclease/exonuclease/phosphatase family metal-dependent hydrolase
MTYRRLTLSSLLLALAAPAPAEELRVATWNLEWFFDAGTSDDPTELERQNSAPNAAEYESRVRGIAAAVAELRPDVMALEEIENEKVVRDLADRLAAAHGRAYNVAFVQGRDTTTGQDVAFLVRKDVPFTAARFDYVAGPDHKDLSKHLRLTATVAGRPFTFVAVHLITRTPDRLKQARTLRDWVAPLVGGNLVVLGDFNLGVRFNETRPDTDIGIVRGFGTPATADDLFDCDQRLSGPDRRTHVGGGEFDRVLLSPSLVDGPGLRLKSIANRRDLATRGEPDPGRGVAYDLPENDQDLSDHFPLLVVLDTETAAPASPPPVEAPATTRDLLAAFWNVENLFDAADDPNVAGDEEFTPDGPKRWTERRLARKLANLARVIGAMKGGKGPDLIGLAEVENRAVLVRLVADLAPLGRAYKIVHKDSPSERGIDTALIYDANVFTLEGSDFLHVEAGDTRDVVEARLAHGGHPLTVFVNHWPSRAHPEEARQAAARVVRRRVDALLAADPHADVLILGDLNDHPTDPSVTQGLRAKGDRANLARGDLYDAMAPVQNDPGRGTYFYRNAWEVLDHVIASPGLLGDAGLRLVPDSVGPAVLTEDQLFDPAGPAPPRPNRSYSGNRYHTTGYSDHLPVTARLRD